MGVGVVMRGVFRRGGIGRLRQFQSRLLSLSADETSGLFENAEGKPWSRPRDGPECQAGGLAATSEAVRGRGPPTLPLAPNTDSTPSSPRRKGWWCVPRGGYNRSPLLARADFRAYLSFETR